MQAFVSATSWYRWQLTQKCLVITFPQLILDFFALLYSRPTRFLYTDQFINSTTNLVISDKSVKMPVRDILYRRER